MSTELTRNFSIIAHIDHGKTTLSDRLMEMTSTVTMRESSAQQLDSMDLEREKGITIKSHPVAMVYKAKDGKTYKLNLLDTPGHVDFSYEVSRALAACEGAILMVDAAQGVEAQTVANLHLAEQQNLKIIPVLNKIDLPAADVDKCKKQLEDILCIPSEDCIPASAKAGIGIEEILEAIVARVPAPVENPDKLLRATVFDSLYDTYRGVVSYVRVFSGTIKRGQRVKLFATEKTYEIKEVGVFTPKMVVRDVLVPGDVGYVIANMKSAAEVKIGDTMTDSTIRAPRRCRATRRSSPWYFPGSIRSIPPTTRR